MSEWLKNAIDEEMGWTKPKSTKANYEWLKNAIDEEMGWTKPKKRERVSAGDEKYIEWGIAREGNRGWAQQTNWLKSLPASDPRRLEAIAQGRAKYEATLDPREFDLPQYQGRPKNGKSANPNNPIQFNSWPTVKMKFNQALGGSDNDMADIVKNNWPDMPIKRDDRGFRYVWNPSTLRHEYIDTPQMTANDVGNGLFQAAAYGAAGGPAMAATRGAGRVAAGLVGAGAEVGLNAGAQTGRMYARGKGQDKFDLMELGLSGVGGAAAGALTRTVDMAKVGGKRDYFSVGTISEYADIPEMVAKGQASLDNATKINVPLTLAEATGDPALAGMQSAVAHNPHTAYRFDKYYKGRGQVIDKELNASLDSIAPKIGQDDAGRQLVGSAERTLTEMEEARRRTANAGYSAASGDAIAPGAVKKLVKDINAVRRNTPIDVRNRLQQVIDDLIEVDDLANPIYLPNGAAKPAATVGSVHNRARAKLMRSIETAERQNNSDLPALLQVKQHMDDMLTSASPRYQGAMRQYEFDSKMIDEFTGQYFGRLATQKRRAAHEMDYHKAGQNFIKHGSPENVVKMKNQVMNQEGGEAIWNGYIRSYIEDIWHKSQKIFASHNNNPNAEMMKALKFVTEIDGTRQGDEMLKAMMPSPDHYRGMKVITNAVRKAASSFDGGSKTAWLQVYRDQVKGDIPTGLVDAAKRPWLTQVADRISKTRSNHLADFLMGGRDSLNKLRMLGDRKVNRSTKDSIFFGIFGSGPANFGRTQALRKDEER